MFINQKTLALWCAASVTVSAFCTPDGFLPSTKVAFVARTVPTGRSLSRNAQHVVGCPCPSCVGTHPASCMCPGCSSTRNNRRVTMLFAENVDEADGGEQQEEVPAEVVAMDGVESEEEAHNVDRPARQQLKKKKSKGKELSEFEVGSTVQGIVRSLATYGAFVDIGATTDGLLHISQLSTEYVGNVNDVLKEGQEVEVRIVNIDTIKGQVALSLMTVAEEATAKEAAQEAREARQARSNNYNNNNRPSNRRESNAVLSSLVEKGWDTSAMVEGTVVSTVDFGCFVRVDASKLNSECEGEFDGLVHISAIQSGRVGSVTDVVNANDTVQVRVKSIDGNKVALSMLSVDDEEAKVEEQGERADSGDARPREGAANWKEILIDFDSGMPAFQNLALVDDRRQ